MKNRSLLCVILAAGMGTRMKSTLPKVLHPVAGVPMVSHVVHAAESLNAHKIVVVVGPDQDAVVSTVAPHETIVQTDRLGTGHAVKMALAGRDLTNTDVMVLYGDVPLVPSDALVACVDKHRRLDAGVTILAMEPENPTGYGRLVTDAQDFVTKVVEELDATPLERAINLCSSGMMVLRGEKLSDYLGAIKNNNAKGEYYLLDVLPLIRADGAVCTYVVGPADDLNGVNDRMQLAAVEKRMQNRLREHHMKNGVTMIDPQTVYLSMDTIIANDVVIEPNVFFGLGVKIETGAHILANCYLSGVDIKNGAEIGPFVHIRPNTIVGEDVVISNFVEVKKSTFAPHAKVSQFACVVDADVGTYANVGAGTIISNWNGVEKFRSTISDYAFVGGNVTLVSPVNIGESAFVTAGSVITDDIPADSMAFGRARQVTRESIPVAKLYSNKQKAKAKE